MSFLIDQIPWWVYVIGFLLVAGTLVYMFSPVLIPIWNALPKWVRWLLGGIFVVFLVFIKGRNMGHENAVKEQEKRNAEGERRREQLHEAINKANSSDVDRRLDKWMRD